MAVNGINTDAFASDDGGAFGVQAGDFHQSKAKERGVLHLTVANSYQANAGANCTFSLQSSAAPNGNYNFQTVIEGAGTVTITGAVKLVAPNQTTPGVTQYIYFENSGDEVSGVDDRRLFPGLYSVSLPTNGGQVFSLLASGSIEWFATQGGNSVSLGKLTKNTSVTSWPDFDSTGVFGRNTFAIRVVQTISCDFSTVGWKTYGPPYFSPFIPGTSPPIPIPPIAAGTGFPPPSVLNPDGSFASVTLITNVTEDFDQNYATINARCVINLTRIGDGAG